ncbi:hypothetical protein VT84_13560 [Gemmata sp. SH-PL17]|nr:hypothetical protein VT84_13560 [Gemmata sp. SH-PL17]
MDVYVWIATLVAGLAVGFCLGFSAANGRKGG